MLLLLLTGFLTDLLELEEGGVVVVKQEAESATVREGDREVFNLEQKSEIQRVSKNQTFKYWKHVKSRRFSRLVFKWYD